ncbi:MAG: hypothetical protein IPL46_08395 [Saprospiraceae bacterium]|nr:hypothetical protein [Saprospiraceae bacterium]
MLRDHIKNIPGWRSNRKIVVFAVDDYGNVRVDSKAARERMNKAGLEIKSRFDAFDSLENEEDLSVLFETLSSVKDMDGRHPIFTALTVVANIDFESQRNSQSYKYELLPDTFTKLGYDKAWHLWQQGIQNGLLYPQFHGREHLNIKVLESNLSNSEYSTRIALANRSYTSIRNEFFPKLSYTAAFALDDLSEIDRQHQIIESGLDYFQQIFGFRSETFNPPGGREHSDLHSTLYKFGIKYIETPFIKNEHQGNDRYRRMINYTGKKNDQGQTFLVRNCLFEPGSDNSIDWVAYCLKQMEVAFRWGKPAIISSHRVNFCGNIDPNNRKVGLLALKALLAEIVTRWPEVEFKTTNELGNLVNSRRQ